MKSFVLVALAMLVSVPALAQDQASCKAFFQVLQANAGTPGLRTGLDRAQKKWWESSGQKKFPGLCLNGSVMSGDKPRYLVIWSKSKSIGQASVPPNEVYGQMASALQATRPHYKDLPTTVGPGIGHSCERLIRRKPYVTARLFRGRPAFLGPVAGQSQSA